MSSKHAFVDVLRKRHSYISCILAKAQRKQNRRVTFIFPLFPLVLLFLQLFNMRINMIILWLILLFKYMYIDKPCRKGGWAYSISLLYRNENLQLRKR